jgi:hypothetical protein
VARSFLTSSIQLLVPVQTVLVQKCGQQNGTFVALWEDQSSSSSSVETRTLGEEHLPLWKRLRKEILKEARQWVESMDIIGRWLLVPSTINGLTKFQNSI